MEFTPHVTIPRLSRQGSRIALFHGLNGAVMADRKAPDVNPTLTPEMIKAGAEVIWTSFYES